MTRMRYERVKKLTFLELVNVTFEYLDWWYFSIIQIILQSILLPEHFIMKAK
jgi:hypothetical protein